jgi:hypothetical protein
VFATDVSSCDGGAPKTYLAREAAGSSSVMAAGTTTARERARVSTRNETESPLGAVDSRAGGAN